MQIEPLRPFELLFDAPFESCRGGRQIQQIGGVAERRNRPNQPRFQVLCAQVVVDSACSVDNFVPGAGRSSSTA